MNNLNASIFSKSHIYLDREFEFILRGIYMCYQNMLVDYAEVENNENKIRNRLYRDYLKKVSVKQSLGLEHYIFHPEVPEVDAEYNESARTDFMVYNSLTYVKDELAYYIIECKRIDGSKTLNDKYTENGIDRFIQDRYPSNRKVNAMLGFIVKPLKINENSLKIPSLKKYPFIDDFEFSYTSSHTTNRKIKVTLYHLMLDFSTIIKKK
ncbi:hypothetical protein [Pedobacter suwonensis]|uniref:hypothetical protein n=1 Tax=Pedobacter suwonensis TaxID=332999 RepID=UPI0011A2C167|nr:hypothetical protein [Pedobacter suwonensis]